MTHESSNGVSAGLLEAPQPADKLPQLLLCVAGFDGRIVRLNGAFERVLGYTRGELAALPVLSLVHREDRAHGIAAAQLLRRSPEESATASVRCRAKDGTYQRLLWTAQALPEQQLIVASGHHDGLGSAAADAVQRELASIVTAAGDAMFTVSRDGAVQSWNPAAERLFGYGADEVLGTTIDRLVPRHLRAERDDLLARALAGEVIANVETQRVASDGGEVRVSVGMAPLPGDASGLPIGVAVINQDIGERKRREAELSRTRAELERHARELERSNRELEQFAYVASHDLSEPLRAITGFGQLLARRYEGRLDEDADRYISHVVDGAGRMQQLINDLLVYSRVGRADLRREAVDAGALVAEVLTSLEPLVHERTPHVEVGALPTVRADRGQLAQVFQNLLANALKFCKDRQPVVAVSAERGERGWVFSVADNGIGIDPQHRERIFELFRRLHNRREYGGTGIGLAVCKRIVEAHAGAIWVEAPAAGGSIFRFSIDHDEDATP